MTRRQLDRWRSALGVDRVNQRTVLGAHVDRTHHEAAVLQYSLGAQQEPSTDGIEPAKGAAVNLDPGGPRGVQRTQAGIEPTGFTDDPETPDNQAQYIALAFDAVPRSVRGCRGRSYGDHGATGVTPRRRQFEMQRVLRIDAEAGSCTWRRRLEQYGRQFRPCAAICAGRHTPSSGARWRQNDRLRRVRERVLIRERAGTPLAAAPAWTSQAA